MAHGLPDYYRGVDIAYQALSQLMVRPTYGAAKHSHDTIPITPFDVTRLYEKSGKGMIYGGYVTIFYSSTQKLSGVYIKIDDVTFNVYSLLGLYAYKVNKPKSASIYLLSYDDSASIYSVGISPNLTFESSFELLYVECHNVVPTVYYSVDYALIT